MPKQSGPQGNICDSRWQLGKERPVGDIAKNPQPTTPNLVKVASALRPLEDNSDTNWSSTNPHDHDETLGLGDGLRKLDVATPHSSVSLGKSSSEMLARTALEMKSEYTSDDGIRNSQRSARKNRRAEFWGVKKVRAFVFIKKGKPEFPSSFSPWQCHLDPAHK